MNKYPSEEMIYCVLISVSPQSMRIISSPGPTIIWINGNTRRHFKIRWIIAKNIVSKELIDLSSLTLFKSEVFSSTLLSFSSTELLLSLLRSSKFLFSESTSIIKSTSLIDLSILLISFIFLA